MMAEMLLRSGSLRLCNTAWLRLLAVLALVAFAGMAQASTYAFRSDTYSWETTANTITAWDQTCTGYPVDDDKVTLNFSGGFTFTFAGTAYSSVRVLSNGMLQFGTDNGFHRTYTNTTLPAAAPGAYGGCVATTPTNVLMGYWVDLNPKTGGSVTWEQKGSAPNRYFVVSWNAVPQYGTSTPYTFQILLYENGEFKYQYGNANASGSNATIGVQVSSSDYTLYSYKSGYNANGSAIRWFVASGSPTRVANYRFDEFSYAGTVGEVIDSSGNSHNGTAVGSVQTTASGYVCRALDIPANTSSTTQAVDTLLSVSSLLGSDGSIDFWFRSNVVWTTNRAAVLFDASTDSTRPFYLMRAAGGALTLAVSDSAGKILTASTAAQSFAAGTWVHVAATWRLSSGTNASVLRVYVNGTQLAVTNGTTNGVIDPSIGTLFFGDNASNFTPSGGSVNSANGQIDEADVYNYEISSVELSADMAVSHSCSLLHHVEIRGSASGLTCTPTTWTIAACQDSACTSAYTGGVVGTLSATGTGMTTTWPDGTTFTIPSGSSTANLRMQLVTAGSVSVGASGLSPSASSATTCNFGSPSCTFTAADSGLLFDVPDHRAEVATTFTVSAVKKADNSLACTPAFASTSKSVNFRCSYSNPTSGSLPVRLAGQTSGGAWNTAQALNSGNSSSAACDGTGQSVPLYFNSSGVATARLQYADVGLLTINGTYTGSGTDAGLSMLGSDTFTAAPSSFGWSGVPSGNIAAGSAFSATVTAYNAASAATPNFGRETTAQNPTVTFARVTPTGAGASNGTFTAGAVGSFTSGAATVSGMAWSEVGTGDLTASLAGYLSSGLSVTGATSGGAVHVIPHHFDVISVTPGCGSFTYAGLQPNSGQNFSLQVTARNASGATTTNYDASLGSAASRAVTFSEVSSAAGSLSSGPHIAAAAFAAGSGSGSANFSLASKTPATVPTLTVRAIDTDGVSSANGSPVKEGSVALRSGRLRIANAFGSEKSALVISANTDYWTGSAWAVNSADSCTVVPASAIAESNVRSGTGASASWTTTASGFTITSGASPTTSSAAGAFTLSAPSGGSTGSIDLAVNLGSAATDQSCLNNHPSTTGANLPWLRSRNGAGPAAACSGSPWDRDPSAHASFGIYSPETQKTVHVRDIF